MLRGGVIGNILELAFLKYPESWEGAEKYTGVQIWGSSSFLAEIV